MNNVLLITAEKVKTYSEISDNVFEKNLLPAIMTAQNIYLQQIIGTCLYRKLQDMVVTQDIMLEENVAYKDLLDNHITNYLIERVIADLIPIVGNKISNLGIYKSNDEYAQNISADEVDRLQYQHIVRSDFYQARMQDFLRANRSAFPELDCCKCGELAPNLNSAEDVSIFLGGVRAKRAR